MGAASAEPPLRAGSACRRSGEGTGSPAAEGGRVAGGLCARVGECRRTSGKEYGRGPTSPTAARNKDVRVAPGPAGQGRPGHVRVAPAVFGQGHPGLAGVAQGLPGLGFRSCLGRVAPVLSGSPWPLCQEVATTTPRGGSARPGGRLLVQSVSSSSIAWSDGGLSALSGNWSVRSFGSAGISSVPSA